MGSAGESGLREDVGDFEGEVVAMEMSYFYTVNAILRTTQQLIMIMLTRVSLPPYPVHYIGT